MHVGLVSHVWLPVRMAICSFVLARSLLRRLGSLPSPFFSATVSLRSFARAGEIALPGTPKPAQKVTSHLSVKMEHSDLSVAPIQPEASEHGECGPQDAATHVEEEEKDTGQTAPVGTELDEDFAYMQRGFTTEIYKIEIRNIPVYVGFKVRTRLARACPLPIEPSPRLSFPPCSNCESVSRV